MKGKRKYVNKKKKENKKMMTLYFKTIIGKKYKDSLDINEKGIPVLKGTDVPVSVFTFYRNFLGYHDKNLIELFQLNMSEEQLAKTIEDIIFFSTDILEFPFKEELESYYRYLYEEENGGWHSMPAW